jgi:GTP-binding protein LepA
MSLNLERIRNFCIIAHIDHGKSTLADRFLEITETIPPRQFRAQVLDDMELERERGITIKAKAVRMSYKSRDGKEYLLNLIDTPGHVDFSYEVTRSLAACEGVILVVDAAQGVEAQTIANLYLAIEKNLIIIPVINKIDLKGADTEGTAHQLSAIHGMKMEHILKTSAKTGEGVKEILEKVVELIPPPKGEIDKNLQALIFDSSFDAYRGVVVYIRVVNGEVKPGDKIKLISTNRIYEVSETGFFKPSFTAAPSLGAGEVGYLMANIKEIAHARIGDTIVLAKDIDTKPLPGYKEIKAMVYAGFYPVRGGDFEALSEAFKKLRLNDSAFSYETESSQTLGHGFRCGFLGFLHMDIVRERLMREYGLDITVTSPGTVYRVKKRDGEVIEIDNPNELPSPQEMEFIEEPYLKISIICPGKDFGNVMKLCQDRRGISKGYEYLDSERVVIYYEIPLPEVVLDFHDRLKSVTRGYGSFDYEHIDFRRGDLVKLDILLNGESVDGLSFIVHREKAYSRGRELVGKLKEEIPQHLFAIAVQAAIGKQVIARETIRALRKDVTAKLYGGDVTRKRKLLEKQKKGKKLMKTIGRVNIPSDAFMAVLKVN